MIHPAIVLGSMAQLKGRVSLGGNVPDIAPITRQGCDRGEALGEAIGSRAVAFFFASVAPLGHSHVSISSGFELSLEYVVRSLDL